eukprot:342506-Hanusia_phi.AAC.5
MLRRSNPCATRSSLFPMLRSISQRAELSELCPAAYELVLAGKTRGWGWARGSKCKIKVRNERR